MCLSYLFNSGLISVVYSTLLLLWLTIGLNLPILRHILPVAPSSLVVTVAVRITEL